MARILIGSSNIRRFYPCDQTKDYPKYKVEPATLKRAFEVTIEAVPDNARVIISVLENFIEREINNHEPDQKLKEMQQVVQSVVDTVVEVAKQRKEARFAMAYPILRPGNKWMTENEDNIRKEFEKAINNQSEINISKIDAAARASQQFENDGVHLTVAAGRNFVGNLVGMAEDYFSADLIDMEKEEDTISKVINLGKSSGGIKSMVDVSELKKVTSDLKNWRSNFERDLNSRFKADNLMFARLRDEMDSETNRKREDRTLVTGFVDPAKLPKVAAERNEALKEIAKGFCLTFNENFDGNIMFATTSGRMDKGNLMLEFRIDEVEKAREVRKAFAIRRAANDLPAGYEKVQVTTVITLATKVRFEIMKAIARRIESDSETAYVPTFLPRPILHIKAKSDRSSSEPRGRDPRKHLSSLTFADSIMQYGGLISGSDLEPAYKKAAGNFRGQMRQHFVVLEDLEHRSRFAVPPPAVAKPGTSGTSGSGRTGGSGATSWSSGPPAAKGARGTKRTMEDGNESESAERSKRAQN